MLFNSFRFIFIFFPAVCVIYFIIKRHGAGRLAKIWLISVSIGFYGFFNLKYVYLIIFSILVNYGVKQAIIKFDGKFAKMLMVTGVCFNTGLLAYFKYAVFIIDNLSAVFSLNLFMEPLVLPVAVSFITFRQIAYIVDAARASKNDNDDFLDYCLFVTFFPQLIAGPIVHHSEMTPQFKAIDKAGPDYRNISAGIFLFSTGLFKKAVIADTLSSWADLGFNGTVPLDFVSSWITSLSYTFQIYFDFSGYTDMAIGAALILNFKIPVNFDSPYKAVSIQDFWRRWHITLGRFLREYVYIPLGGNRKWEFRVYANLFITFLIGGIWHGSAWTFVLWGVLHGMGLVVNRAWKKTGIHIPKFAAWLMTFFFVHLCWIFFRAETLNQALNVVRGLFDFGSCRINNIIALLSQMKGFLSEYDIETGFFGISSGENTLIFFLIAICCIIVFFCKNSNQTIEAFEPRISSALMASVLFFCGILTFISEVPSSFIYFQF